MLIAILSLFKERKTISLSDLSIHFKTDANAMQSMLNKLIDKDLIEHINFNCEGCSSGCKSCSFVNDKDIYKLKQHPV